MFKCRAPGWMGNTKNESDIKKINLKKIKIKKKTTKIKTKLRVCMYI